MRYFKLPDLGEGLHEAEIVQWHVQEGDTVSLEQPLVSVETAKAWLSRKPNILDKTQEGGRMLYSSLPECPPHSKEVPCDACCSPSPRSSS